MTTTTLPASTQTALDKVNTTRQAWLEARRSQKAADEQGNIIRQRRKETEANATAQNDEWRRLFRENGGVMTPEMKKLRSEVAFDRESLEEFDALLAAHTSESELLPWETGDRAKEYISAHNHLVQLWQGFMQAHGQQLIRTLRLLKITLGQQAADVTGTVHTVNVPATVLKNFIVDHITNTALRSDALPEDAVFELTGVFADDAAHFDAKKGLSPAARHKIRVRREMADKKQA